MSLMLGENLPESILNKITKKLNKNMYKGEWKQFIDGINKQVAGIDGSNKMYAKFAQELTDKRTYFEMQRKSKEPCI